MAHEEKKNLTRGPGGVDSTLDEEFEQNEFDETISCNLSKDSASQPKKRVAAPMPAAIGRYKIRGVLGEGGFGTVYVGIDEQLDRRVAIKVPLLQSDQRTKEMFLQEARQLAKLTHPSIVTVFDVGEDGDFCYIVTDYLQGQDLNHWLKGRSPSWEESVRIVATIADGLAAAHARNTVHRDVKPANIIVIDRAEGPVPVLVDFGLALSESSECQRGQIAGTPNFMSPEQARGEGHRIDGRTDIYSLGVVLYRMLCGQLPFRAKGYTALLQQVIEDEPQPPRQVVHGIPRELERICLKAMSKRLVDRYTTAGDMASELRSLLKEKEEKFDVAVAVSQKTKEKPVARDAIKILIAEDHELTRFNLQRTLEKWGHQVVAAEDGEQAWELFQKEHFAIVITDWMMPRLEGVELVQRIRASDQQDYVYIIMLTAKAEKYDIVTGMGAGADDFVAKPWNKDELRVRLRAGIRITKQNRELHEANRRMKRGLEAAARIQRAFLPTSAKEFPGIEFQWHYGPCDELGGDMLNIVELDDSHLGLYVLDVNGQGIPAALQATTFSRFMSSALDPSSLLVERNIDQTDFRILEPAEVAVKLNQRFTQDRGQFIKLLYGVLDLRSHEFRYVSAGNPPLLYQKASGALELLEVDGFPIGLDPENDDYEQSTLKLHTGDRLVMYSDGLPDARNKEDKLFSIEGIHDSVKKLGQVSLNQMVRSLADELRQWRAGAAVNDDVSILAIEAK